MKSTIAAIATAAGRGGIGVVRVSGPRVPELAKEILGRLPCPRTAEFRAFRDEKGDPIDEGVALFFPAPNSFTGENVLELQGHGGTAVMRSLLNRCIELGATLAEPGEFTRRAFLNNKLDLVQAESVADLIDAVSEKAARSALRSLQGEFSRKIHEVSEELVQIRMLVEGTLDFPGEEIEILEETGTRRRIEVILQTLREILSAAHQGSVLREGLHVVLVGRPNVGKSSLLNRLAGEDIAIVTEVAGTTRDAIRQHITIEGVPVHLIDTAGLRETDDPVEKLGLSRTWEMIRQADVVLLLSDIQHGESEEDKAIIKQLPATLKVIRVLNKIDLSGKNEKPDQEAIYISAKTGEGVGHLKQVLLQAVGFDLHSESAYMARARHLTALRDALEHVTASQGHIEQMELFAEELSLAHRCLGSIVGEFTTDDLLGEIFSRFCIGK